VTFATSIKGNRVLSRTNRVPAHPARLPPIGPFPNAPSFEEADFSFPFCSVVRENSLESDFVSLLPQEMNKDGKHVSTSPAIPTTPGREVWQVFRT
jgi:hypothetical protein